MKCTGLKAVSYPDTQHLIKGSIVKFGTNTRIFYIVCYTTCFYLLNMKITTLTKLDDFRCENSTTIGLQSKTQPDFNIQLVKVVTKEIYIDMAKVVSLYRISLTDMKMYLDFEGTLKECFENLDQYFYIYSFQTFGDFYDWYTTTLRKS